MGPSADEKKSLGKVSLRLNYHEIGLLIFRYDDTAIVR